MIVRLFSDRHLDRDVIRELNVERVVRITQLQPQVAVGFAICVLVSMFHGMEANVSSWVFFLLLLILMCSVESLWSWFRYRNKSRPHEVSRRAIVRLYLTMAVFGTLWGSALGAMVFQDSSGTNIPLIIAAGLASIAITMTYYLPLAALMFGFLCATPPAIVWIYLVPEYSLSIIMLYMAGVAAVLASLNLAYTVLIENIEMRVEKERLALEAAALSETKSQFIASMSHELRTPLNAISGFAELTRLRPDQSAVETVNAMDKILSASEYLVSLIDQVLDISKLESGSIEYRPESVRPEEVCSELLPMVRNIAEGKKIALEHRIESGCSIRVDRLRLRQVLLNLLNNAAKYTLTGGKVRFDCEAREGAVVFSVSDTGIGVPESEQEEIFSQFYRASNVRHSFPGTGLGLYHCNELVTAMNGEISMESAKDVGSKFEVRFPCEQ